MAEFDLWSDVDEDEDYYPRRPVLVRGPVGRSPPRVGGGLATRQLPVVGSAAPSTGLALPFELTFERILLGVMLLWFAMKFFGRMSKMEKKLKKLTRKIAAA